MKHLISTLLIFSFTQLYSTTSFRKLTTTITAEQTSDGQFYTVVNNYGIWTSVIIYGLFWLLIFLAILIPYGSNIEIYAPVNIQATNRVNVELAKLSNPPLFSPDILPSKKEKDDEPIDNKALIYLKCMKISPVYSIWHSRSYGESTKKISLFVINMMVIIMFLSILYNSNKFNVSFIFLKI